jgi:hypothetical protein
MLETAVASGLSRRVTTTGQSGKVEGDVALVRQT